MKSIVAFLLFMCLGIVVHAQIANTKWTGNLMVPDPAAVNLSFKADVFEVYLAEGNQLLETMTFKVSGDTLILRKTSGGSPCPDGSTFTLKYAIQGEQLMLTLLADDCAERAASFTKEPFTKVKE
jgi:hypothetical protein